MTFNEAANFLFDLRRFGPSLGTDTTRQLLAHLDDPHEGLRCIQVAGSNGKGSTARMVERILREAGFDIGLYTSPHLTDVRERIRVNGRKISKARFVTFTKQVRSYITDCAAKSEPPTFFETLTALALWEFDHQDVDIAILEVGLGGRYDATSVVDPVASAVTSITLEHTEYLGDTVAEIARDKAQVAPTSLPLVTGATGDALAAIQSEVGATVTVGRTNGIAGDGGVIDTAATGTGPDVAVEYRGRDGVEGVVSLRGDGWAYETKLPLLGCHQADNAGVAVALTRQVADVETDDVRQGLQNAHWPGRFEVMDQDPLIVLDGAHNPGGCQRVAETLTEFDYANLYLVVGVMSDKDHCGMAAALPDPDHVITCEPNNSRAEDDGVLASVFEAETDARVETETDVAHARDIALEVASSDDCVLVAGSLYAVAEARQHWTSSNLTTYTSL